MSKYNTYKTFNTRLNVRIDDKLNELIRDTASVLQVPISDFVRETLEKECLKIAQENLEQEMDDEL